MKISFFLPFVVILFFASCKKETVNVFTETSPEIDTVRKMIKDYEAGDWASYISHYTENAKIYHNRVNSNPRNIQEAVEEHKNFISQVSFYGYSKTENQTVEMIIDSRGTTWVSFWGVWMGTFTQSGNKTEIIVHITSKFENGKIVQEHMYWDTAPFVKETIEKEKIQLPNTNPEQ